MTNTNTKATKATKATQVAQAINIYLNKLIDDEKQAQINATQAAQASLAGLIADSVYFCTFSTDGKIAKKQVTERVFAAYGMNKTDAGKSAIYNKIKCVVFLINKHYTTFKNIKLSVANNASRIIEQAESAVHAYESFNDILSDAKETSSTSRAPSTPAASLEKATKAATMAAVELASSLAQINDLSNEAKAIDAVCSLLESYILPNLPAAADFTQGLKKLIDNEKSKRYASEKASIKKAA